MMTNHEKNVEQLLTLIQENPGLRIVPMVQSEVVASDEHGWWVSRFGSSSIEEIYDSGDQIYIRSIDEEQLVEDELEASDESFDLKNEEVQMAAAVELVNCYPWEKVIAVKIGLL